MNDFHLRHKFEPISPNQIHLPSPADNFRTQPLQGFIIIFLIGQEINRSFKGNSADLREFSPNPQPVPHRFGWKGVKKEEPTL
jgi:hypothetical protein